MLGAVRVDDQAQFHPPKYVYGLARKVDADGSHVFERTRALAVSDGEVKTDRGTVHARHVIIATQLPFLDRGLFFAKAHPQKSYAVAGRVEAARAPSGMNISAEEPTRSIRSAPDAEGSRYLVVGGEGHRPGDDPNTEHRYTALEDFFRERFADAPIDFRWSTHDYVPVDRLPYIGRLTRRDDRVLVATGSQVALHFVGDRLRAQGDRGAPPTGSGHGHADRQRHYALYRDDCGELHALSATCTHLGCLVGWSSADRTWECPCHGSRFTAEGALLQGPATRDLPREDL